MHEMPDPSSLENDRRALFAGFTDGLMVVTLVEEPARDFVVEECNAAMTRQLGLHPDVTTGVRGSELLGGPELETLIAVARNHIALGLDRQGRSLRLTAIPLGPRVAIRSEDVTQARQVEHALRESERQYRLLAENATDVIWIIDVETMRFRYVSPSIERQRGYRAAEVLKQSLTEVLTPRSRAYVEQALPSRLAAFARGVHEIYVDLLEHPHRDGHVIVSETATRFVIDDRSGRLKIYGVSRDVSDRKRAEDAAAASAARFQRVVDNIPESIAVFDPELHLQFLNAAGRRHGAASASAVAGPHEAKETLAALARARDTRAAQSVDVALGGREHTITCSPILDEEGALREIVMLAVDRTEERDALAALRARIELNEQLSRIADSVPGVICTLRASTDGALSFAFVSQNADDLFGIPEAALREDAARIFERILDPSERERVERDVRAALRRGEPWHVVFRYDHPAGGLSWLELRFLPEPEAAPDGTRAWHGFAMDVTSQRATEDRLARLSRFHRTLSDTNEAIVRARDSASMLQTVTESVMSLGGLRGVAVFVPSADGAELVPTAASGPLASALARARVPLHTTPESGPSAVATAFREDRLVTRDLPPEPGLTTSERLGSAVALPLRRDGVPIGVLALGAGGRDYFNAELVEHLAALANDVSFGLETLDRAAALRASEERYRVLLDNLADVVFAVDATGIVSFVSNAVSRFGATPADVTGRPASFVAHRDDAAIVESAWRELSSDRPTVMEARVPDRRGKVRFVRVSARPIVEAGVFQGAHGVVADLTVQHETEEQLRTAQKMEAVGRLAGGVAHDFNNILSVIHSYTEFALSELREADPLYSDLQEVLAASHRAEGLTRQLLAFSRKQVLKPTVVDVNALVTGLEKMLERLLGEDVDLVFVPDPGLGRVKADPGQLEQVLMNLAVNSRDAMPSGGTLTIRTSDVVGDDGVHTARLFVTDTGIGMDGATVARAFEPFFTTKETGKGTGLGLATVYGIVTQSGGTVRVESAPGRGTTFIIDLPVTAENVDSAGRAPGRIQPFRGDETVLVVEDDPTVRKLVRRILVEAGYDVLVAANGGEALLLCETHGESLRLMLTDVVMPSLSGPDLARRLATACPNLKVLYMSGYTNDALVGHGISEKDLGFIPKPFSAEALTRKVRAVLESGEPVAHP